MPAPIPTIVGGGRDYYGPGTLPSGRSASGPTAAQLHTSDLMKADAAQNNQPLWTMPVAAQQRYWQDQITRAQNMGGNTAGAMAQLARLQGTMAGAPSSAPVQAPQQTTPITPPPQNPLISTAAQGPTAGGLIPTSVAPSQLSAAAARPALPQVTSEAGATSAGMPNWLASLTSQLNQMQTGGLFGQGASYAPQHQTTAKQSETALAWEQPSANWFS